MSGIADTFFGSGDTSAPPISQKQHFTTQYGSDLATRPKGARLTLDPSIRKIQERGLGSLGTLLNDFRGNRNAFVQARVNPLREQIGRGRSNLNSGLDRRSVFGSFANQDRQAFDMTSQRALGDATATATQEAAQAERAVILDILGVGTERFNQEMAALGLSTGTQFNLTNAILGRAGLQDGAAASRTEAIGRFTASLAGMMGGGMGGGGNMSWLTSSGPRKL